MKRRADDLARIGKLATQMHALGRWKLTAIEREHALLAEDLRAVFEAMEIGDLAYGGQAKLNGRHIRSLEKRIDALTRESERVRMKTDAQRVRAKLAASAAETAAAAYRDQKERKDLAEIVERAIARRDASQR